MIVDLPGTTTAAIMPPTQPLPTDPNRSPMETGKSDAVSRPARIASSASWVRYAMRSAYRTHMASCVAG